MISPVDNTNSCPAGSERITSAAECEAASGAVGKSYNGEWSAHNDGTLYPKGCSGDSHGYSRFSPHATGGAKAMQYPICKKAGC